MGRCYSPLLVVAVGADGLEVLVVIRTRDAVGAWVKLVQGHGVQHLVRAGIPQRAVRDVAGLALYVSIARWDNSRAAGIPELGAAEVRLWRSVGGPGAGG